MSFALGYASPGAVITEAGHLPQIEQPAAAFGALDAYINKNVSR